MAAAIPSRRLGRRVWPQVRGWLFIAPVVLGTLVFNILPMLPTIYFGFTDWNGLGEPKWTGLQNYERALGGRDLSFGVSVRNTLVYTIAYVPLAMAAGLALAVLVNQKLRGVVVFRALYFLPVITSVVAVGMVWRWIFNWQFGILNWALELVGIVGPRWLGDAFWAMVAVVIVAIWSVMGYQMVIFLAGLQGVPPELHEAAMIDGAGTFTRFRKITLPLLTPTVFFIFIISLIGSFQAFGLIYVMTGGGPGTATYVYVYHLWKQAFQSHSMGYGSALAWMLFVVIGVVTFFQWRLQKRWVFYQ